MMKIDSVGSPHTPSPDMPTTGPLVRQHTARFWNYWTADEVAMLRRAYAQAVQEASELRHCEGHIRARAVELMHAWGSTRTANAIRGRALLERLIVNKQRDPAPRTRSAQAERDDPLQLPPARVYVPAGAYPAPCECGGGPWYYDELDREWRCWRCCAVRYVQSDDRED